MIKFSNIQYFDHLSMPFRHFLYFLPRLSILLILTILRHMSLKSGHMARFDALYAPHVPQPRTDSALQRPICPTCPSTPDTWRASTAYLPHMSLRPGHIARFNALYAPHVHQQRTHGAPERRCEYTKARRRRRRQRRRRRRRRMVGRFIEAEEMAQGGAT